MSLIKVFSGSQIMAQAINVELDLIGIPNIIRNHIESAIMAGFGTIGQSVDILVDKKNVIEAKLAVERMYSNE